MLCACFKRAAQCFAGMLGCKFFFFGAYNPAIRFSPSYARDNFPVESSELSGCPFTLRPFALPAATAASARSRCSSSSMRACKSYTRAIDTFFGNQFAIRYRAGRCALCRARISDLADDALDAMGDDQCRARRILLQDSLAHDSLCLGINGRRCVIEDQVAAA